MVQTVARAQSGEPVSPASPARRDVAFLAWGSIAGRSKEMAEVLGGEARCFFPIGTRRRPPVPLRYLMAAVATGTYLLRRRPKLVIFTNPPVPGALVAYLWSRIIGAAFALDSHPGGFGAQGDTVAARLQRWHRFLVRRAAFVMVTDDGWAERVRSWGGTPVIVHEAPGGWDLAAPARHGRLRVLVVGTFSPDEPVADLLEATGRFPQCDFVLTGEPARLSPALRHDLPGNVRLAGFLDAERYRQEMSAADAVVALTTEPTSVMRAAYEAVYARRPLVLSDWPVGRELFRHAIHAKNDADALVEALSRLVTDYRRYLGRIERARVEQLDRWRCQRRVLVGLVRAAVPSERDDRVEVMGVTLNNVTEREAITKVLSSLDHGDGGRISNLNVDILRQARLDPELRRLICDAELVLADGMPILWASRIQGTPLLERVPASEMIWSLCHQAACHGVGVLLLGGSSGSAEQAAGVLADRYEELTIDSYCPPMGFEHSETEMAKVHRAIEQAAPGVVFCGFGAPKQERLMAHLGERYPSVWFVACGGTFSMVTGELPKAPTWMRERSLEWVHRLRLEPRRLFRRYIVHDLPFAAHLFVSCSLSRMIHRRVRP